MNAADRLIAIAAAEVGYLEKASAAGLDDKTTNAGHNNFTKYARDLDAAAYYNGRKQGVAWCAVFADWCFYQAFGLGTAQAMQCQGKKSSAAGCHSAMGYFQKKGRLYTAPEPGDRIFFWSAADPGKAGHTGIVEKTADGRVYTIEGNTAAGQEVVPNGGGVCRKSYALGNSRIAGYGRPDWSLVKEKKGVTGMYQATVTAPSGKTVNLRSAASGNARILKAVPVGAEVEVLEEISDAWARVRYAGGEGYMMRKFLVSADAGDVDLREGLESLRDQAVNLLETIDLLLQGVSVG